MAGTSMIKINGFENQAQFQKEFPEGAVINIYDLNDKKAAAYQRQIMYYREPVHGPWRVTNEGQLDKESLTSYSNADPSGSGHAWVILTDLVSVEEAIDLDFSLKDVLKAHYNNVNDRNTNVKQKISERELIVNHLLNSGKGGVAADAMLKGSAVNATSVSGKVCCEFIFLLGEDGDMFWDRLLAPSMSKIR